MEMQKMNEEELKELSFIERDIKDLKKRLEAMEERKKEITTQVIEHFESVSEEPIETEDLRISYIKPSIRYSIDKSKLEEKYPDIAKEFEKETRVKSSIRITLKGEE